MPTLAGNKHVSIHFFPRGPRPLHLSTEKSTVRSVGNGHQSGYSRADTINSDINTRSKGISISGKYLKNTLKIRKPTWIKYIIVLEIFMFACCVC